MATGGGDLQGPPGHRLAADLAEVGQRGGSAPASTGVELVPRPGARQAGDDAGEVGGGPHRRTGGDLRLDGVAERHHDGDVVESVDHRGDAGHPADRAVETELADERMPVDGLERQLGGGDEDTDGDRQVEPGPGLALAGRGQVDGDAAVRPGEPAADHGGPHSIARLAARRVGHADHVVAGKAVADEHLDGDGTAAHTEHGRRRDGCEHRGLLRSNRRTAASGSAVEDGDRSNDG